MSSAFYTSVDGVYGYDGSDIHMIDESTLIYACGNGVKFLNTATNIQGFIWRDKGYFGISALAVNWKTKTIAFAVCENDPKIYLYNFLNKEQIGYIEGAATLEIASISFNRSGTRIATISQEPDNKLMIYDVVSRSQLQGAVADLPFKCDHVSISPTSPNQIAASGSGGIVFWLINTHYKQHSLIETKAIIPSIEEDLSAEETEEICSIKSHCWDINNNVYASNAIGELFHFNVLSGMAIDTIVVGDGEPVIMSQLITKTHLVVGCADGVLRWIGLKTGSVEQKVSLPRGVNKRHRFYTEEENNTLNNDGDDGASLRAEIIRLSATPSYETVFLATDCGSILDVSLRIPKPLLNNNKDDNHDDYTNDYNDNDALETSTSLYTGSEFHIITESHGASVIGVGSVYTNSNSKYFVTLSSDGYVLSWNQRTRSIVSKIYIPSNISGHFPTCLATNSFSPCLVVGTSAGILWVLLVDVDGDIRPISRYRAHNTAVSRIKMHPTKPLVASIPIIDPNSSSKKLRVIVSSISPQDAGRCVAYAELNTSGGAAPVLSSLATTSNASLSAVDRSQTPLTLFWAGDEILVSYEDGSVYSMSLPSHCFDSSSKHGRGNVDENYAEEEDEEATRLSLNRRFQILTSPIETILDPLVDFSDNYHRLFAVSGVKSIQRFDVPWATVAREAIKPSSKYTEHACSAVSMISGPVDAKSKSCLIVTGGTDGAILFWNLTKEGGDLQFLDRVVVHSKAVVDLSFSSDGTTVLGASLDGNVSVIALKGSLVDSGCTSLHRLEKYIDVTDYTQYGHLVQLNCKDFESEDKLVLNETTDKELTAVDHLLLNDSKKSLAMHETIKESRMSKVNSIRQRTEYLLQQNNTVPDLERMEEEEFTIDLSSRNKIVEINQARATSLRNDILNSNYKKELCAERIREEFWDSQEIQSRSIHALKSKVVVRNLPVLKLSEMEQKELEALKYMRTTEAREIQLLNNGNSVWSKTVKHMSPNMNWMVNAGILQANADGELILDEIMSVTSSSMNPSAVATGNGGKTTSGSASTSLLEDVNGITSNDTTSRDITTGDSEDQDNDGDIMGVDDKEDIQGQHDLKFIDLLYHPLAIKTLNIRCSV